MNTGPIRIFWEGFYAYSNQAEALAANPDTLETYTPMGTNDALIQPAEGEPFQWFVVSDVTDYAPGAKYSSYIGGDNPFYPRFRTPGSRTDLPAW